MGAKEFILSLIFKTVHTLVHYSMLTWSCVQYLNRKYSDFYREYTNANTSDYEYVLQHTKHIKKLPQHISIMLNSEEPSYSNLAKMIMWCTAAKIPFISIYDYKGTLKKNEDKIHEAVEKMQNTKELDIHIMWHGEHSYKNRHFGKKTHVKILTLSDGQCAVVNLVKQFSIRKVKLIEQELVDAAIKNKFMFPNPDLAFYTGNKEFALNGYPPWQICITEFTCIGSHYSVTPEIFVNELHRFGKIEQKLGR